MAGKNWLKTWLMRIVATNTSPLSCLISLGRLDLLDLLFDQVLVPDAVIHELKFHP